MKSGKKKRGRLVPLRHIRALPSCKWGFVLLGCYVALIGSYWPFLPACRYHFQAQKHSRLLTLKNRNILNLEDGTGRLFRNISSYQSTFRYTPEQPRQGLIHVYIMMVYGQNRVIPPLILSLEIGWRVVCRRSLDILEKKRNFYLCLESNSGV